MLLARALLAKPDILILDEPTQGLDQPGIAAFYQLIEQVRTETGVAVLMVSHDLHVVMSASDRVICLNGHICCEGAPSVVTATPEYRALFGLGTGGALALYQHVHDHDHSADHGHGHDPIIRISIVKGGRASMFDDFLTRAALAGFGLSLATGGPLGSFVVWRRMAYFGDATAHAAVLGGVALSFAVGAPVYLGILIVSLAMAVTVAQLSGGRGQGSDTVLGGCWRIPRWLRAGGGLAAHLAADQSGSLAVRRYLVCDAWRPAGGLGGALVVVVLLVTRWNALLTATLNEELARSAGGISPPARERLVLTLALAMTVAVSIKIVGALLIAALLIIPAATARRFARTPEAMAMIATGGRAWRRWHWA